MRLVVDSNRIIAALIRNSTTRKILFSDKLTLISPEYFVEEITKYKELIVRKAKITEDKFEILLELILDKLDLIPREEYCKHIDEARKLTVDSKDVPFIAVALATHADGIWTDDHHFMQQTKIRIYTTKDLLAYSQS